MAALFGLTADQAWWVVAGLLFVAGVLVIVTARPRPREWWECACGHRFASAEALAYHETRDHGCSCGGRRPHHPSCPLRRSTS